MISRCQKSSTFGILLGSLVVVTLSSGCASFNDKNKSSDFSCKGLPDGATCMGPIDVYKRTNNADSIEGTGEAMASASANAGGQPGTVVPVVVQRNLVVQPKNPKPILEEAQVMRVWVAPFIDSNQDLQWPGHIFTEVTPRRWSFGERDVERIRSAVPLQVSSRPPDEENSPLPGSAPPDYVPGMPPNPTESIPPGPSYMRQNEPELERRPYGGSDYLDYN